jgi:cytoskeletal protein CcmA (bactofilin family)
MEYAAAKSTLCRQCGRHFDIAELQEATAVGTREAVLPGETQNLLRRFEGLWNREHSTKIHCFECSAEQEISSSASSTICPACSANIDLRDYKITTSFSRNIRTHGTIHVSASGDLSSNTVVCRSAVIKGKLRGSLHCVGDVEFKGVGRIPGKLTAHRVIVAKKANVQFSRQLQVGSLEIRGSMSGEVVAETTVLIRKNGSLDGNVTAKSITVYGKVHGNITVGERCELKSRCTLQGDLKAARLVIEEGATFIGKLEVTSGKPAASKSEIVRHEEPAAPVKAAFGGTELTEVDTGFS